MPDKKSVKKITRNAEKHSNPKDADNVSAHSVGGPNSSGEGFTISNPVVVEMNPSGKWEPLKSGNIDEENIRNVVQLLLRSNVIPAAKNAAEAQMTQKPADVGYVPVILMPVYNTQSESTQGSKDMTTPYCANREDPGNYREDRTKKSKKRGFVLQRFTDFDLLSQW